MKWLILFTLMACGHQEPSAIDLQDDDGDLVANAYEAGSERFIAELKPLAKVNAKLTVSSPADGSINLSLTNLRPSRFEVLRILGQGPAQDVKSKYFQEHSILHLSEYKDTNFKAKNVELDFQFDALGEKFHSIVLVRGTERTRLAEWQTHMKLLVSAEIARDLLGGRAQLDLNRSEEEEFIKDRIRSRTYRVLVSEDEETRSYYVSQSLPFENFLEELKLRDSARDIRRSSVTEINELSESWWYRAEREEDEKVIYFGDASEVTDSYLLGLPSLKETIQRVNGQSQKELSMNLSQDSSTEKRIFMRIYPHTFDHRNFADKGHSRSGGSGGGMHGGGGDWSCNFSERFVSGVTKHPITENILRDNLQLTVDGKQIELREILRHFSLKSDKSGKMYWEYTLEVSGQEFKFGLLPARSGINVQGIYASNCNKHIARVSTTNVAIESSFKVQVEAYLEN